MADILLNFSSQWPSMQVAKVIQSPHNVGEAAAYPYVKKIPHNLGYPPLALGFRNNLPSTSYGFPMEGIDVDENYIYIDDQGSFGVNYNFVVIYALDISQDYDYTDYESQVGDVLEDTSGGQLDLRDFLLHSRAVSPMVLSVKTRTYNNQNQDGLKFTYTHPLNYPIFNFGYIRWNPNGTNRPGIWQNAPLAAQAFPWLNTDGFTSNLGSTIIDGQYDSSYMWIPGTGTVAADRGSIITLRNPAVITNNRVSASI